MCQVKFKYMIVLVHLILTTTLGDITINFVKPISKKRKLGLTEIE